VSIWLLLATALGIWLYRTDRIRIRPRTGPGASADAWARQTAGPLHRLLALLGIETSRYRLAARRKAGAVGERRTARRLELLPREGWTVLHDRRLPRRYDNSNLDHLLISPTGRVILTDSKRWSARFPLTVRNGQLLHGDLDVTDRLDGLHHETETVSELLGVPVTPLVVMDGPPIPAGQLVVDGVLIVPADQALDTIRHLGRGAGTRPTRQLAHQAATLFPPYTRRPRSGRQ